MNKSKSGFTIVELLVVIVVIGILAAITAVAYRGVQQRATTAAITSAVDQWEKVVRAEAAVSGTIPSTAGLPSGYVCLGNSVDNFPANSKFIAGRCRSSNYTYNAAYFSSWATKDTLPNGQLPSTRLTYGAVVADARGIVLSSNGTLSAQIMWIPQVVGECGRGDDIYSGAKASGDLSGGMCAINFTY